jgi:hypothetical protein
MEEIWKEVPGYEGFYEVSDLGRVRSLDRSVTYGRHGAAAYKGRLLQQRLTANGYPLVGLSVGGRVKSHYIHHLVLLAFAGPRPETEARGEIRHLDGDKTHNALENLAYGTIHDNWQDRRRHRHEARA